MLCISLPDSEFKLSSPAYFSNSVNISSILLVFTLSFIIYLLISNLFFHNNVTKHCAIVLFDRDEFLYSSIKHSSLIKPVAGVNVKINLYFK